MNALWLTRPGLTEQSGGDTTQILKTAEALRAMGCTVNITDAPRADPAKYDVVHLFHLERVWENVAHCRRVARTGTPIVLSPIYWKAEGYDDTGRPWLQRQVVRRLGSGVYRDLRMAHHRLAAAVRSPRPALAGALGGARRSIQEMLRSAAVLLPNSVAEKELIEREFGLVRPTVVVPNAADVEFLDLGDGADLDRDGVLCVGRIEPRKNQLNLIRAMEDTGLMLTIVGRPGPSSKVYYRRCRREAGEWVRWVAHVHGPGMGRLYAAARVHASVSWYETPGLASLEAALCGCALVVTPGGSTREYLREDAEYCEPDDVPSIQRAVKAAAWRGASSALQERVAQRFSWEMAANRTLEAYELAHGRSREQDVHAREQEGNR